MNGKLKRALAMALVAVLAVAGIYSISSVISFSLPMMVGVVAGCFSSQFIAPTLFAAWQNHVQAKEKSNS